MHFPNYQLTKNLLLHVAFAAAISSGALQAQVPSLINYQGRVAVGGVNFDGLGQFKFALVNANGTITYWSNNGTSFSGSQPTAAVPLAVSKGLYSVLLGDTSLANMTAITPYVNGTPPDVHLRVWFNDGVNGSQRLTPDQRLAPASYLADGAVQSTSIAAGAVTSTKIAAGAVGNANIAVGSLDFSRLNVPAAPGAGQVLSFNGTGLTWTTPTTGAVLALPYSAQQASTNALFSINNTSTTGNAWGIYAHSASSAGLFGQTHGNAQAGVIGRNDSATGIGGSGVFGYSATKGFGVLAISEAGTGVWAATNGPNEVAVYGQTSVNSSKAAAFNHYGTGIGLEAYSQGGTGLSGRTQGNALAGVLGRNDGATGIGGSGVFGYSSTKGFGVQAVSEGGAGLWAATNAANESAVYARTSVNSSVAGRFNHFGAGAGLVSSSQGGDGLDATTLGTGKSALYGHTGTVGAYGVFAISTQGTGILAKTEKQSEPAGFFWNSAGGDAIRTDGNATINGTATVQRLTITGGADLAEPFAIRGDEEFPKGSVLVISDEHPGELQLSHEEYDQRVAGIISGANGIESGLQLSQKGINDEGGQPVALTGRVYCRADASFGAIKPGDQLTTSSRPGHARKVGDHTRAQGAILGKAMSGLGDGTGYVLVLVTLQ